MLFTTVARINRRQLSGRRQAFLVSDNWDDFGFKTLFELVLFDDDGNRIDVGPVKIMRRGMPHGRVELPGTEFDLLTENYCSLGQEQNYYESLVANAPDLREQILSSLRDCVFDLTIFEQFASEPAMNASLMRSISERKIRETFRGALTGQVPLTAFHFSYRYPAPQVVVQTKPPRLDFSVYPQSSPPTNIHAIIGRNGVGKTTLLWDIAAVLCRRHGQVSTIERGEVSFENKKNPFEREEKFTRLVTVAFSAFDPFRAPKEGSVNDGDIHYSYIGLKKRINLETSGNTVINDIEEVTFDSDYDNLAPQRVELKSEEDLVDEFSNSLANCVNEPRLQRWKNSLALLESDPGFRDLDLLRLAETDASERLVRAHSLFETLSSGHKVVLLIVTRLVELVDERTLVLFDEPESHLHPPLLSSLVRVLSALLTLRNGAAIIATHSPVVLQEMPRSCVWMLRRSGEVMVAERPLIETFGENVGILTREVFGLEVTQSGFHKMVADAVGQELGSYDRVLDRFNGQLGAEARAIALVLSRNRV
jgi:predicted ATPase